jgi:decaprenylphospho-beta-D-ribofuranose 2-oxidase
MQYQSFVPIDTAYEVFSEQLKLGKRVKNPSYLGVVKRHKPDNFLFSHALDGFSLALDFKVTNRNKARLIQLTQDMNKLVLEGGGRFYFAKDSTLTPQVVEQYLGKTTVNKFKRLKAKVDPENILQTDLYRRCFG